eukprot:gene1281-422_t
MRRMRVARPLWASAFGGARPPARGTHTRRPVGSVATAATRRSYTRQADPTAPHVPSPSNSSVIAEKAAESRRASRELAAQIAVTPGDSLAALRQRTGSTGAAASPPVHAAAAPPGGVNPVDRLGPVERYLALRSRKSVLRLLDVWVPAAEAAVIAAAYSLSGAKPVVVALALYGVGLHLTRDKPWPVNVLPRLVLLPAILSPRDPGNPLALVASLIIFFVCALDLLLLDLNDADDVLRCFPLHEPVLCTACAGSSVIHQL